jgi:hypothetical protein
MDPPSTSCLVACAAGKPHCWPMGTRRDLGWALLRLSHWTSPSRASSRNRYAACPCNCKVFCRRMQNQTHASLAKVTQPTARLEQSAPSMHPAQGIPSASQPTNAQESEHTGRKKPPAHRSTLCMGTCAITTGHAWLLHMVCVESDTLVIVRHRRGKAHLPLVIAVLHLHALKPCARC